MDKLLTPTEKRVALGVTLGYAEKEIADKLFVSPHTVHAHTRNIRKKWRARNIADITRRYILSLDDPKTLLKATLFLGIQLGIIIDDMRLDLRKPINTVMRAKTGRRKTRNDEYYVH